MARIRETLRRADAIRGEPQEMDLVPRPHHPEETPFRTGDDEEVPFIEVGGRETPIDASPSVLVNLPKLGFRSPLAERMQPEHLGKQHGTAAPAVQVGITVLVISFCRPEG
jgi:hypothetical protein